LPRLNGPLKNFGIINSITKLHLDGISTETAVMFGLSSFVSDGHYKVVKSSYDIIKILSLRYFNAAQIT
jgi:UDP-glucose 4-epimerase